MDFNPYKVLAIDPSADADVIAAVYRTLSKKYHPDVNKSPEAETRMREINRAYDMLKDPEQRRKLDADLARQASPGSGAYSGSKTSPSGWPSSGARPASSGSRPAATGRNRSAAPDWSGIADQVRRQAESVINNVRGESRPNAPDARTLYFYQKELLDREQQKSLKVAVYHDGATNRKVCNIRASAPNARGIVTAGEVFLDSAKLFDLTLAFSEANRVLAEGGKPIEMNSDHDILFRQAVEGLGRTYIAVEVIKKNRNNSREALLLLGEKNARTEKDGVISGQTPTQLRQIGRVFQDALSAMR